jgi:predicted kinase
VARVLLQLSGVPGSGKSTLARRLAAERGMVVLDTDVLKSAQLDTGASFAQAGRSAYVSVLALAADLLDQGREVIVDSPCRYVELLEGGQAVAIEAGVRYTFIELRAADPARLLTRLDARAPKRSQVASSREAAPGTGWELGTPEATLRGWQDQLVHPESDWLQLDADRDPDELLAAALDYLDRSR